MKISKKIQLLRKEYNYSQEGLAEICNVTRQSISKWESDITRPDLENIMIMSNLFSVSIDTLVKDELEIDSVVSNNLCHKKLDSIESGYFEGLLIK